MHRFNLKREKLLRNETSRNFFFSTLIFNRNWKWIPVPVVAVPNQSDPFSVCYIQKDKKRCSNYNVDALDVSKNPTVNTQPNGVAGSLFEGLQKFALTVNF